MSKINMNSDIVTKGRRVFDGTQYLIRIAPTVNQDEVTDFTAAGETILLFPKDTSLAKTVEQITESYTGLPTDVLYEGKNQIGGDINMTATAIGLPFIAKRVLGGVTERANTTAIMALSSDGKFTIQSDAADELKVTIDGTESIITIADGKTVEEAAKIINEFDIDLYAVVIQGGDSIYTLPTVAKDCNVIEFISCGVLLNPAEKPSKVYHIIPELGDPDWNNILIDSPYNDFSAYQFTGCELLSLNVGYENSALTTISTKIYGTNALPFTGTPTQKDVDDVKNVAAQTGGRTKCYINGIEATSVKSGTVAFEWSKEQDWNISNELYEIPRSKYSYTVSYEAMFNAQSKHFFEEVFNAGKTLNTIFVTEYFVNGKACKLISWSKYVKGTPYYPTFAPGSIVISASYNGIADYEDPSSNGFLFIVE